MKPTINNSIDINNEFEELCRLQKKEEADALFEETIVFYRESDREYALTRALHQATSRGHLEMAKWLKTKGAAYDRKSTRHMTTVFTKMLRYERLDVVKWLYETDKAAIDINSVCMALRKSDVKIPDFITENTIVS